MARRRRRRRRSFWQRLAGILASVLLVALLASAGSVAALRWLDPLTSSFIVQRKVEVLMEGGRAADVAYRWVPWERISPEVGIAVVAAEDQLFPEHVGFDVESIRDALEEREQGGRLRGASTISQQVAKNLFLWPGRSWVRKGLEAYFTVLIETMWSKRRILEVYVNIAQFGDDTFGVGAASERFFAKPAADITTEEAALLAAVLPNPKRLHVDRPSRYVRERTHWIRSQMRMLGGSEYLRGI
ncbi:MAG: monofunctional biosynthetic peptidoglycan transglycosylase [Gammaproteobacteria bacterium]|nr:monofunctional biosynthetic peptidoglycan transglycosylase [Gammaproteobacteria bacterium]